MAVTSVIAAAISVGTCLRERERHTLQSIRAHGAGSGARMFEGECTFARRLRTVVNRPQTGLKLGPSAVGQRPALIHNWRSSGPHGVNLTISHGPSTHRRPWKVSHALRIWPGAPHTRHENHLKRRSLDVPGKSWDSI